MDKHNLSRREIRVNNLRLLLDQHGGPAKLGRLAQCNATYLSQISTGVPLPSGTPRSVGDHLADRLEDATGKERGWIDQPHHEEWDQLEPKRAEAA